LLIHWQYHDRGRLRVTDQVTVDDLAEAEIDAAIALWTAAGLTRPWNDPASDARRALQTATSTILAARSDESIRGTVMVGHDGHRGWVYYLAVDPALQRGGIGRELMRAAEGWLIERGVPKLNLMVRGENASVRAFYERIGYELSDVVVMAKFLTPEP
jgi:ribosomal protein S18 acetylase RimI-like enzyme